jgi:heterodisulfide reductase subunit B
MVTACPMCMVNLDMKQADTEKRIGEKLRLPVYYLSDLIGLALGLSKKELAIDKHFVKA